MRAVSQRPIGFRFINGPLQRRFALDIKYFNARHLNGDGLLL